MALRAGLLQGSPVELCPFPAEFLLCKNISRRGGMDDGDMVIGGGRTILFVVTVCNMAVACPESSICVALVVLIVPVFRLFLYLYHPEIYTFVLLPCRIDTLLIGVLCAYGMRQERFRSWLSKNQSRLYQLLCILLAGAGYLTVCANDPYSFEMAFWGYSWMALLYACLLLIIVGAKEDVIVKFMHFSPLRNLGIISYSVYLMHVPINILMHGLILGREVSITNFLDGVVTFMALGVTLLLAILSWRFFEKPIIKWGHSFSYSGKSRIASDETPQARCGNAWYGTAVAADETESGGEKH
jgi:peptidoglycan/LPS O-acetylase OafA/YrhL